MKYLRKYIRYLLSESPLSTREKIAQSQFDYRDYIRNTLVDYTGRTGKQGPNYPKRSTRYDLSKESNDMRRLPKQLWNQNADHQFFKEKIRKFHLLGYAGKLDVQKYFSPAASKNEISCFAVEKTSDPVQDIFDLEETDYVSRGKIILELEGRTTWCGNFDAFTEQLKDATPEQIERMASSGLAKRPGRFRGSLRTLTNVLILDSDDFVRNNKKIDELVLDNWKVKCFWYVIKDNKVNKLLNSALLSIEEPLYSVKFNNDEEIERQLRNWFDTDIGKSEEELRKVAAICESRSIPMKVLQKNGEVGDFQILLKVIQHIKNSLPKGYFEREGYFVS